MIAVVEAGDEEGGGQVVVRMQDDTGSVLRRQNAEPAGEFIPAPVGFTQVVMRQPGGEEFRQHGVLAGLFGFRGDDG